MNPPPTLPTYIFLMSDTSTRQLACDVASMLADTDPHIFVDDFLSPIHEAFSAMFELDLKRDLASPSTTGRLFIPHGDGEQTEADYINSLEMWFCAEFGDTALGDIAYKSTQAMRADFDYSFVFRDANMYYVKPFIANVAANKLLFVDLTSGYKHVDVTQFPKEVPTTRTIRFLIVPDVDAIVKSIMEFDA